MENIKELDAQYIAHTYARFPLEIVSGKGSLVYDENGKEYIDLGTGIAVNSFGVADDEWIAAVTAQLAKVQHMSNLYYTEPCAVLAKMLCEKSGMKKVFFGNSGAEANEGIIKAARKYAAEKKGPEYYTIITLRNSFHGRTLTTLAATGQDKFHQLFTPLTPGFAYADANDLEGLKKLAAEVKPAGILIECVQGEGGVLPLTAEFVRGIAELCAAEDIVFMVDEVQTGNGRTGKCYAYQNFGVLPDAVSTAKGLGGGLPIGAVMLGEKLQDVFGPGDHGSTFGGNPIACAGAISVLSRIDERLLELVRRKSAYIFSSLNGAEGIESVAGMGLMIGIKTVKPAGEVVKVCMDKGVLCLTAKDKVRLLPALNIPQELLEKAIGVIKEVCK
ncbi:MAG: acetylornithine/succinylornithine family transaminase [Firmicutes bacterium]|nr:acetylornithine/succinylornithine family transaminase [Bacillota bacterium]